MRKYALGAGDRPTKGKEREEQEEPSSTLIRRAAPYDFSVRCLWSAPIWLTKNAVEMRIGRQQHVRSIAEMHGVHLAPTLPTLCTPASPAFAVASAPESGSRELSTAPALDESSEAGVTLFVFGWENVEPGPLSWAFPSAPAALAAVRAMPNAVAWSIYVGAPWASVDAARASGALLVEQSQTA